MARPFGTFKYDNLQDLESGIDKYFTDCDQNNKPYTMTGLALALNIDVRTLSNYGQKDDYFPAINRARQKCIAYNEERLYDKDGVNGAKFSLTNNSERMGGLRYADRQEMALAPAEEVDPEALDKRINELLAKLKPDE